MNSIYTYTVTDTTTGQVIADKVTNVELEKIIDIQRSKIPTYAGTEKLYRKRYKIFKSEIEESKKRKCDVDDIKTMIKFDRSMAALRHNYTSEFLANIKFKAEERQVG